MRPAVFLALVGATGLVACGSDDDEACPIDVRVLCPDCGSGQVLRATVGEEQVAARAGGGYLGLACDTLRWHGADFEVEHEVTIALPGPEWTVLSIAVGDDDVGFHVAWNGEAGFTNEAAITAVSPDGNELWNARLPRPPPAP